MEYLSPGMIELVGGAALSAAGWYIKRFVARQEERDAKRQKHDDAIMTRIENLEQAVLDLHARMDEQIGREQQRLALEASRAEESAKIKDGIEALLRDRLLQSRRYFCSKKYIPPQDFENITAMAESYTALGGNGVAKKAYEDICALPFEAPQTAE